MGVLLTRHLKFTKPENYLEKKEEILIGNRGDLDKAIALLKKEFADADGETLLCEIWTPVSIGGRPDVPVRLKPKKKEAVKA